MSEKKTELKGGKLCKELGLEHLKFTSPARRSVPDRIILGCVAPEDRETVAKYVRFVEYKSATGKLTSGQVREIMRLEARGFRTEVVNDIDNQRDVFEEMIGVQSE
jgi:hypothetical protein